MRGEMRLSNLLPASLAVSALACRSLAMTTSLIRRLFRSRSRGWKTFGLTRHPVVACPLRPVLVAEVGADHITGEHMRHGARLLGWRADKPPASCTMDQIR